MNSPTQSSEKPLAQTSQVERNSLRDGDSEQSYDDHSRPDPEREPSPPPIVATAPATPSFNPLSWHVITLLAFPAVLGVLARLGVTALATFDGKSVFALAWVQGLGCFMTGLAVGKRDTITEYYPPLYTAITTGFCGSFTSLAAWHLDVFQAWSNADGYHRNWLRDVVDGLTQTILTMLITLGTVAAGIKVSAHVPLNLPRSKPGFTTQRVVAVLSLLAYLATIPLYFKLSPSFRIKATSAILFSFPGVLSRHLVATQLNPIVSNLPLGSLAVNTLSTSLLAAFHVIQRAPHVSGISCVMLQGLMDGYCGCLSTVSSLMVELRGLKARAAWRYFIITYVSGQLIMVAIVGGSWWSGSIKEHSRCSGPS